MKNLISWIDRIVFAAAMLFVAAMFVGGFAAWGQATIALGR